MVISSGTNTVGETVSDDVSGSEGASGSDGVSGSGAVYVTVTVKLAVPVFPASSDAVQVTGVGPTGKNEPEAGEQVGPEVTLTLSVAETSNEILSPELLEAETVMSDGTFTVGRVASMYVTVTVKLAVTTLPATSDAEHVTVVVWISKCPEKPRLTV